ncbi:hypothetical protein DNH61_24095 [Paenibacillus sambharensis]|uniref:Uncharacterized protein n=1 Tax=Paenibacillus sambharensis TaxID=1803190 RepID=A0A2W1L2X6_9BACL|nr:hypothetical protein [Paenibacillus sambharensis]PZD93696.1 hypothetical protein DNH61_24095 [Paenibacillus sambharensis]
MSKWAGIAANAALGLIFPYVLAGVVLLVYGFMQPAERIDQIFGILIAAGYTGLVAAVNWITLRGQAAAAVWQGLFLNALAWSAACALTLYIQRYGLL